MGIGRTLPCSARTLALPDDQRTDRLGQLRQCLALLDLVLTDRVQHLGVPA
ncbi:hypothetical protein AB0F92_38840 [Kitasatospora aureofaciens]|uniref:hypothetical protein n=1 Tax=Kitasatospora aureofaciens TaxID=1894 RepID=UPI00268C173A|nr:hypothetical protein BOQ63_003425 [Streptomyces viridifaciens]